MCGEKAWRCGTCGRCTGSPPRVRGKDRVLRGSDDSHGITPACAGKRCCAVHELIAREDHPRVCGEKELTLDITCNIEGSPPRVRGKVPASRTRLQTTRITPACAGKSFIRHSELFLSEDHPRVCGEKSQVVSWATLLGGSPPRVRGKASSQYAAARIIGITPACAGKSVRLWPSPR